MNPDCLKDLSARVYYVRGDPLYTGHISSEEFTVTRQSDGSTAQYVMVTFVDGNCYQVNVEDLRTVIKRDKLIK